MYINRGDFWRAVTNLGGKRGSPSPRLTETGGHFELDRGRRYETSWVRRLLRHSALVRYLVFNALVNPFSGARRDLAMASKGRKPEAAALSEPIYARVLRYVVSEVRKALPRAKILFVVEPDRPAIRAGEPIRPTGTSALIARDCPKLGCAHLDLSEAFRAAWRREKRPFEFAHNVHCFARAHGKPTTHKAKLQLTIS